MKTYLKIHKAFTMIELIMVIVILGIVSSIGSQIIANVYKNYIIQRATHRASLKTELAAQQIANMLSYRIPGTTLARNPNGINDVNSTILVTDATDENDTTHTLLEWIGTDNDGLSATLTPPWNGFCDIAASSQTAIKTPGSQLTTERSILSNLSGTTVNPAIFFRSSKYSFVSISSTTVPYDVLSCLGMVSNDTSCISAVSLSATSNDTLTFAGSAATSTDKVITEHYKLAWTAYAIRPITKANGLFDLELYYNYQPWNGTNLNGGWPSNHATIITNVSVFKFAESGNTFRFKICAQENIGEEFNVTICKEKAVIL